MQMLEYDLEVHVAETTPNFAWQLLRQSGFQSARWSHSRGNDWIKIKPSRR